MRIRKFCIKDYDDVIKLWKEADLPYKPKGRDKRENIEKELQREKAIFLVAEINGKIIGSVFGTDDGRKGWINRLAVAPEYQGQGVATSLTREIESVFLNRGIEIIACLIENWNTRSMQFFEKNGYVKHTDIYYFTKRKNEDV